MVYTFFRGSYR